MEPAVQAKDHRVLVRGGVAKRIENCPSQMEEFANLWQLAEQIRQRVAFACDAKTSGGHACRGWDEFSNADISRFCADILGKSVEVVE